MAFSETGKSFRTLNQQGTPLLQNSSKPSHYGTNDLAGTLVKCYVDTTLAEGTDPEEEQEQRSLFTESIECHSKTIELEPVLNVYMFSSLRQMFHVLMGGWCNEASLKLQNCGSVARDHLALERTFLAYMRTSLTVASAGVAFVQLFNVSDSERVKKFARPLGASMIVLGLLVLGIGLIRYFVVQSSLIQGSFPMTRLSPMLIAVTLTSLVTIVFWLLLAGY